MRHLTTFATASFVLAAPVLGHHSDTARQLGGGDQPSHADFPHLGVIGIKLGRPSGIFCGTIRIMGDRNDLLGSITLHQPFVWLNIDSDDHRVIFVSERHPLLNPAIDHPEGRGIGRDPVSTTVGQPATRLEQQQAPLGGCREKPPATSFLDKKFEILVWLKAKQ